jgi:hypothetical protein
MPLSIKSFMLHRGRSPRRIKLSKALILRTAIATIVISFILTCFHGFKPAHYNKKVRHDSQTTTISHAEKHQAVRTQKHNQSSKINEKESKATIAYAWTLAKCEDFQSSTVGMIDVALVLQYSVHQISSRVGKSEYDYKMYVFVHESAEECSQIFREVGYTLLVFPQPVKVKDIRGAYLRENVDQEVSIVSP